MRVNKKEKKLIMLLMNESFILALYEKQACRCRPRYLYSYLEIIMLTLLTI